MARTRLVACWAFLRLRGWAEGVLETYKGRLDLGPGVVVRELRLLECLGPVVNAVKGWLACT